MNKYSHHVRHRNGWGTGFGPRPTHCHECGAALPEQDKNSITTGYGCGKSEPIAQHPDAPTLKKGESLGRSPAICYACCASHDKTSMRETGRLVGYLVKRADGWHVTNWPGSLDYPCRYAKKGSRNIGRTRIDAWFTDETGAEWHAVNIGDNQIARCKRLKG